MSDGKEVNCARCEFWDRLPSNILKDEQTIAELRAEVAALKGKAGIANPYLVKDALIKKHEQTIATQARVIEKLKERLTSWISETHPNDEHLRNMCLMVEERELAAIEKEGAK